MKKFYITTSIAYTNAPPHIGFALELIQADVIARYHRLLGEDVFFLTGTDEHGIKIAKAAQEDGYKNPKNFVDKISDEFKKLTKVLNISNDNFIRTTDKKNHWPVVKELWKQLEKNGDLYPKDYEGWYCVGCEAFIDEKTKDSLPGGCFSHPNLTPIPVKEKNWFFKLSKYSKKIKKIIESDEIKIIPEAKKNEVLGILNQEWIDFKDNLKKKRGLKDISFSRSADKLKWGIPVPDDETQTIYVWADALTNYISALEYPDGEKFKKYWPADVHCIGKDILKFHALIWPGMLLSLGLPLPKAIFVHGFITAGGQKMSKSLGNVIDPFELVKKYGADAVRYFLLREIPPTEDGDFTYEKFETRYNSDLASGIGNLVARVRAMGTAVGTSAGKQNPKIEEIKKRYKKALEEFKFNEALKVIWDLIAFCDKYIDEEKPWEGKENSPKVLEDLIFAINNIADMLKPFLPETSEKISKAIEIDKKTGGFKNKKRKPLFPRI